MCVAYGGGGEDRILGYSGWREGNISCGSLEKDGIVVAGVMVKDELNEKIVGIIMSEKMMADVLVFEKDVARLICGHALQCVRSLIEKQTFMS